MMIITISYKSISEFVSARYIFEFLVVIDKTVFGTEFHGDGIQRFGDIAPPEGMPPLPKEHKMLIIHLELPVLGGHILMEKNAAERIGLKVEYGNTHTLILNLAQRMKSRDYVKFFRLILHPKGVWHVFPALVQYQQ